MINLINLKNAVETVIRDVFDIPKVRPSETAKVRPYLIEHCVGYGCDIGFGGDKIKRENCVGIDLEQPYTYVGTDKVDLACDIGREEIPVADNFFDYVYSSHLIEDFEDTAAILKKMARVVRPGGKIILAFPDQRAYEQHCRYHNAVPNKHHRVPRMGLRHMLDAYKSAGIKMRVLYQSDRMIDYNVMLVVQVYK